jgi:hypothetical protein
LIPLATGRVSSSPSSKQRLLAEAEWAHCVAAGVSDNMNNLQSCVTS